MASPNLLVERDGAIVTITLNRPERRNALDSATIADLTAEFASLTAQAEGAPDGTRVVIVTGAGDKAFAAGADVAELATLDAPAAEALSRRGAELTLAMEKAPFVIIAAVNGVALGGGCELALGADFIYASERAVFGFPEVGLGVIPGFGGTQRLPRRIGVGPARELVCSGVLVNAERARELGLANAVVPHAELLERVRAVAATIGAKAPLAVTAAKRVLGDGLDRDLRSALDLESSHFGALFATEDAREGLRAFVEKRAPAFKGR
jgi:enoyl-CoA hydratase